MVPVLCSGPLQLHPLCQAVFLWCVLASCVATGVVQGDSGGQDVLAWIQTPHPTALVKGDDLVLACQVRHVNQSYTLSHPLTYAWTKDEGSIPEKASMFSNHSLFVPRVGAEDFGRYTCTVTMEYWSGETSVTANVIEAYLSPFFIHPTSQLVKVGDTFVLTCVTGQSAPHLEVYWMKDGERFYDGTQITAAFGDFDAEGLRLQTSMRLEAEVSQAMAGVYQCVARNKLLQLPVLSLSVDISLESIPSDLLPVIEWTLPETLVIAEGQDLTLGCRSQVSTDSVRTDWYRGRYLVDESKRVYVLPNISLAFYPLSAKDKGTYHCKVTNSKGTTQSPTVELVIAYLDITFQEEPSDSFALYGENVILRCRPPDSLPQASVIWYKNFAVFDFGSRPGAKVIDNNLHLSSVMKSDIGDYYCVAVNKMTNPSSRTSREAKLRVEGPPQMTRPPVSQWLLRGSLLHLTCLAESDPSPSVTWTFQGRLLTGDHSATIMNRGQELWISNLGKSWEGEYICTCTNKYGTISASASVTVIVPPVALHSLGVMTVTSGLTFTLACPVDGFPIPSVEWFHNGTKINMTDQQTHGQLTWRTNSFDLVIDHVTPEYSGSYKCVAKNEGGTVTSTGSLVVYVPPYFLEPPKNITTILGQTGVLTCRVGGNTHPVIHWVLNGSLPVRGQLSDDNSTLTFPSVGWEDVGVYTCSAVNGVKTATRTASVSLLVPPVIQSLNQPDNPIRIKTQFVLSCSASGIPPPTIKWTHRDVPLIPSLNGRVRFPRRGVLVIESALEEDAGIYKCIAESVTGSDSVSFSVSVYGHPHPPTLLAAVPLTSTSVYLLWQWSTDGQTTSHTVDLFEIFYKKKSNEEFEKYADIFPSNVTRVEVMGLDPGVTYVFHVKAVNDAGDSEASNSLTALTFHSAPSSPTNLQVIDLRPRSAKVTWEPPAVTNGVIKLYQYRYRRENIPRAFETVNITSPVFPTQEVTLQSLRPFFSYTLQARAATRHEDNELWGSFSPPLVFQTKMEEPSLPPQTVRATAVDANSILVTWEPVPELGRNGPIVGYMVTCHDTEDNLVASHRVHISDHKRTVYGLSPWRTYWFVVKVENPVGVGPGSMPVIMTTLPLAPMTVPGEVTPVPQSSTSIMMSWKPLPPERVTCEITEYRVSHRRKSQNSTWIINHIPSNTTSISVTDLIPWTSYEFTVAAFTDTVSPGLGPHTLPVSVSTLQGESSPVTALDFTTRPTSVLLSWKPPLDVKGILIGYSIAYRPMDMNITSKILDIPANTTVGLLNDLLPNTTYNVSVAAFNEAGNGKTTILLIKTLAMPPPSTDTLITTVHTDHITNVSTAIALEVQEDNEQNHVKKNLASIVAGSIIGAVAFVIMVVFICVQCKKYRKKQRLSYAYHAYFNQGYTTQVVKHRFLRHKKKKMKNVTFIEEEGTGQANEGQESGNVSVTNLPQTNTTSTTNDRTITTTATDHANTQPTNGNVHQGDFTDGPTVSQSQSGNSGVAAQSTSSGFSSGLRRFSIPSLHLSRDYSKLEEDKGDENLSSPTYQEQTIVAGLRHASSTASVEGMMSKSADDTISIMSETLKRRSRMRSESAAAIAIMRNSQIISIDDSEMLIDNDIQSEVVFNERTVL